MILTDNAIREAMARGAIEIDPFDSPFERPCEAVGGGVQIGPFTGWRQCRKTFAGEAGPSTADRCWCCGCWAGRHVPGCKAVA